MSLLTICQNAADLLSITRPAAVVASTDQQVRLLYALANEEGNDLSSRGNWQALMEEQTFTTTATQAQATALPTDIDHFVQDSFFDRTTRRQLIGPIPPQQWQAIQAQPALNRVFLAFRERQGVFLITPSPPAGHTIAYEYISSNWAKSPTGTPQPQFMADADTSYLDEGLMTLGVRWRFLKSKGLSYSQDFDTYEQQVAQVQARDGGATALSMSGRMDVAESRALVGEGNFGLGT